MFDCVVSPYWTDKSVFLIGGGPSLEGFKFKELQGVTVGINDSALRLKTNVMFSMDVNWMEQRRSEIINFKGIKYLAVPNNYNFDKHGLRNVTYLRHTICEGLTFEPNQISGSNSGFGALNLAIHKEAKSITLLGYDMGTAHKTHWHDGYSWYNQKAEQYNYSFWIKEFDIAAKQLCQKNIDVVNANPKSLITAFTRIELESLQGWNE